MLTPKHIQSVAAWLCLGAAIAASNLAQAETAADKSGNKGHMAVNAPTSRPAMPQPGAGMPASNHPAGVGHPEEHLPPGTHADAHVQAVEHREMEHREMEHREMEHREMARERYMFHEHDVHRFGGPELERWRGGRWNNTCFSGRCGWWWFSAGQWYFYTQPVYPYPMVVSSVAYVEPVVVPAPAPVQVIQQPPPPPPPPAQPMQPPPKFLYYCDNPPGFYPSVQTCNTDFKQVAAPQ